MLTSAQASTLHTAILGDATISALVTASDWNAIADNYNSPSAIQIWKQSVEAQDLIAAILPADFVALTTGGQLAIVAMVSGGSVDATKPNINSWFSTIFAGKATTLANLTIVAQRAATKYEALFTTNSVSSVYGYNLTGNDVRLAMGAS